MKKEKAKKILMIIGLAICMATLAVSIVFIAKIIELDVLRKTLIGVIIALASVLLIIIGITQRWIVPGIITKIVAIAMIVAMIFCINYINITTKALDKISNMKTEISNVRVYVMSDSGIDKLQDVRSDRYGIVTGLDNENTEKALNLIAKELNTSITYTKYTGIMQLMEALYNNKVDAIVLNSAFIPVLESVSEYSDMDKKIKSIWSVDIEKLVEDDSNTNPSGDDTKEPETKDPYDQYKDYLYGGDDVFTLYVSGIDTNGSPMVNRNSDVNILITFNTKTRQILMINTPRDFYVPLSISNGVKDKLTHAGCYGIQVSVDTLQMLYGIKIDDYLKINFTGFVNVIDQLGGVNVYSEYDFTSVDGYSYKKGYNMLDGRLALSFARERHAFGSGDRQRGKNQMAVIKAIIDKCTSTDALLNYESVLGAISDSIATSMSRDEITDLIKMQLSDMKGWNIVTYSVDGKGDNLMTFSLKAPNYVMVPTEATVIKAKEYLAKIYAGEKIEG
jgi:LCP family protein required for cell wall assembly